MWCNSRGDLRVFEVEWNERQVEGVLIEIYLESDEVRSCAQHPKLLDSEGESSTQMVETPTSNHCMRKESLKSVESIPIHIAIVERDFIRVQSQTIPPPPDGH